MSSTARKLLNLVMGNTAPDAAPSNDDLSKARKRLIACKGSLSSVQAHADTAKAALDEAMRDEHEANNAYLLARSKYSDEPSETGAKRVTTLRTALDLAQARTEAPRKRFAEAMSGLGAAQGAVDDAEREVARLERELHLQHLRKAASVEEFKAFTAPKYARLLELREEMRKVAAEIDTAFAASHSASEDLRSEGISCDEALPLAWSHLIFPIIEAEAKKRPQSAAALLQHENLQYMATRVELNGRNLGTLAQALHVSVLDHVANVTGNADPRVLEALQQEFARRGASRGSIAYSEWEIRKNREASK